MSWQSLENDQWTIHRYSESASKGKSARAMSKQTKVGNNSTHWGPHRSGYMYMGYNSTRFSQHLLNDGVSCNLGKICHWSTFTCIMTTGYDNIPNFSKAKSLCKFCISIWKQHVAEQLIMHYMPTNIFKYIETVGTFICSFPWGFTLLFLYYTLPAFRQNVRRYEKGQHCACQDLS